MILKLTLRDLLSYNLIIQSMNEYPSRYPDLGSFVTASSITPLWRLEESCRQRGIVVDIDKISQVMALMTPSDIRDQSEHTCTTITALDCPTFDFLMQMRQGIRNLGIVPLRAALIQHDYDRMTKETFLWVVRYCYLDKTLIALVKELYPYDIPSEVGQYIVWVRDSSVSDYAIAEFIAKIILISDLTVDDMILFERSKATKTHFVQAAIPEFRHIHMWTRGPLKTTT